MAPKLRELLRIAPWVRHATEGTRAGADLVLARLADLSAAAGAKHALSIHVPVLEAYRAPRPEPRRHRLPLRVRLAPHAGRLVFRRDARADLVGVRPRRGAVEHVPRRRRRGRRRLGPRRLRGLDLLADLPVAPVAPVDALAVRRTVGRRAAPFTGPGILLPANRAYVERQLCTSFSRLVLSLLLDQFRVHDLFPRSLPTLPIRPPHSSIVTPTMAKSLKSEPRPA